MRHPSDDAEVDLPEDEWKARLTPEQYRVLREQGTEPAFTGTYHATKDSGAYHCAGCDHELFSSAAKFDSGSGWPSFWDAVAADRIGLYNDDKLGYVRVEVRCRRCGSHLGHVFDDGPHPTGKRYCINSIALNFRPDPEK